MAKKGYIKEGVVLGLALLSGIVCLPCAAGAIVTKIQDDNYREELYANEFFQETKALDLSTASESFEKSKQAYEEGTLSPANFNTIKIQYDDKISYINSDTYMIDYYDNELGWQGTSKDVNNQLYRNSSDLYGFAYAAVLSGFCSILFGVCSIALKEDAKQQETEKELAK